MAEGLEARTLLSIGLDPTFGFGGNTFVNLPPFSASSSYNDSLDAIAAQNGQPVAVGTLTTTPTSGSSTISVLVARFQTDGVIDPNFGSGGSFTIPITQSGITYNVDSEFTDAQAIAVQTDGSIDVLAVVNPSTSASGSNDSLMIAQLTPNGALDTSFGTAGVKLFSFGSPFTISDDVSPSIALGPDGKIVVASTLNSSTTSTTVFGITRFNTNGTLDTSFNTTGVTTVSFPTDGSTPTDDNAYGVVVQPNSAIVVVGQADLAPAPTLTSTPTDIAVVRLTAAGALDTTFNSTGLLTFSYNSGGSSADLATSVALVGTQIVVAGASAELFTQPSGSANTPEIVALTVTRLNANGTFDTTFNGSGEFTLPLSQNGVLFNSAATAVTVLTSGSILVGGVAAPRNASFSNNLHVLLAQLTPNGALDSTYGTVGTALLPSGTSISGQLIVQTDGKVLFLGNNSIYRTTAPTLAVASSTITSTGAGTKLKATSVTLTFNTSINPTLAKNIKIYLLRGGKPKKLLKIKSLSLDSTGRALTFNFAKIAVGKGFQITLTPGGIVAVDGNVLSGGSPLTITIAPSV